MSAQERTREIGLMNAMVMSGGRVTHCSALSGLHRILGSVTGALAAVGVGTIADRMLAGTVLGNVEVLEIVLSRFDDAPDSSSNHR